MGALLAVQSDRENLWAAADVERHNPELHSATRNDTGKVEMGLVVGRDRGCVSAVQNKNIDAEVGRNVERDWRGQTWSNATHASVLGGAFRGRWDRELEGIVADDHRTYAGRAGWVSLLGSCGFRVTSCTCLLYTSPSPRDRTRSRMPSSA